MSLQSLWYNIRIHHECEGRIKQIVPRITVWHHEACRVMANDDPERRNFLSCPHMNNNGFFILLTTVLISFILKKLPEVLEYAKMHFYMKFFS